MSFAEVFGAPFDSSQVPPTEDYVVLPPGEYPVKIDKASVEPTKAQDGHFLKLEMTVQDGPCKGRKLFDRLNLDNPNQQAREIAARSLSSLAVALRIPVIQDEAQLIGGVCFAQVKVKDDYNNIRKYISAYPDAPPTQPATPSYAPPPPAPIAPPPQAPAYAAPAPQPTSQWPAAPVAPVAPQPAAPPASSAVPPWKR